MKKIWLFIFLVQPFFLQFSIKGQILDADKNPIFAASILLKNKPEIRMYSDFDGYFLWNKKTLFAQDTLIIEFPSYQTQIWAVQDIPENWTIQLQEDSPYLKAIYIEARPNIAQVFASEKIQALDIYTNPLASGDVLKALQNLPFTTQNNKSAVPSLRGSAANRTQILLNGVPIENPVRAAQLNQEGFFSIFNTDILAEEQIFPSNPPLYYPQKTSGVVDIQTLDKINKKYLNVGLTLAGLGFSAGMPLSKNKGLWIYGNYQNYGLFQKINSPQFDNLYFQTEDFGLQFVSDTKGGKIKWNGYFAHEDGKQKSAILNYQGEEIFNKYRFFNIISWQKVFKNQIFTLNNGSDVSFANYHFGNRNSDSQETIVFSSFQYQYFFHPNWTLQTGLYHRYSGYDFKTLHPTYFFALKPQDPTLLKKNILQKNKGEFFSYLKWEINEKWTWGFGLSLGIFPFSYSGQSHLLYQFLPDHMLRLALGHYEGENIPQPKKPSFSTLKSNQIALEYALQYGSGRVNTAIYAKQEPHYIFGFEHSIVQNFWTYFSFSLSYSMVYRHLNQENQLDNSENLTLENQGWQHFLRSSLHFQHPKIFNFAVNYSLSSGNSYFPLTEIIYRADLNLYQPVFSNSSANFPQAQSINMVMSRTFTFKKWACIPFFALNNLFNFKQIQGEFFNEDYSEKSKQYTNFLSFFLGIIFRL